MNEAKSSGPTSHIMIIPARAPKRSAIGNTEGILINEPKPNNSGSSSNPPIEKLTWWDFVIKPLQEGWRQTKDYIHTSLDVAGSVPVVGVVFDGMNGVIYAAEGNVGDAAMSFGSAALDFVPGAGTIAKGAKYALRATSTASKSLVKVAEKTTLKQIEKSGLKEAAKTSEKAIVHASEKKVTKLSEKAAAKNSEKETNKVSTKGANKEDGIAVKDKKGKPERKDCPVVGHPVNPISGVKLLTDETELDFVLPAALPLLWQRSYFSDQSGNGWLGQGWSLPFSSRLLRQNNAVVFIDSQGRIINFPSLEAGQCRFDPYEQLYFSREENGRYCVTTSDCRLRYLFSPLASGEDDPQGNRAPYFPLTAIQDANDNLIRFIYDDAGLPQFIHDAAGRWLKLFFITLLLPDGQKAHRLQRVVLMKNRVKGCAVQTETLVSYRYSAEGDLAGVVDSLGQTCREFRYINHILTGHAQPGGLITRYDYDAYTPEGKVVRHTTNLGQRWLFDYHDGETRVTDPLQRVTCYQYNDERAFVGFVDASGQTTRATLDTLGRSVTFTLPGGRQTQHIYDRYGKLTGFTDTADHRTTLRYDAQHRLTSVTDVMKHTTRYEYHSENNTLSMINPLSQRTEYRFGRTGFITEIKSDNGISRQMKYNGAGQLISLIDCCGYVTNLTYQDRGRITTLISPDGTKTIVTCNAKGKPLASLFADGSAEYSTYDALGRLTGQRNVRGAQTEWQLDLDGLPLKRTNAIGENFHYQYDVARRLILLTNENGADYRLNYDHNDNILCEQTFDNMVTRYRYNSAGQQIEKNESGIPDAALENSVREPGIRTTFRYDNQGRIIEKIIRNEALGTTEHSYFDYNAAGLLILAKNSHSTIKRCYDELGQRVSETCEVLGQSQTLQHQYDANGQCSRTLFPDGTRLDYFYYGSGYLLQINVDGMSVCEMERDNMHRETCRTQGTLISHFGYSPTGQLIYQRACAGLSSTDFSPALISRSYQYDHSGNLLCMHDQHVGKTHYHYDDLDRLIHAGDESFAYDPASNLVEPGASGKNARVANNRLTHYQNHHYVYDRYGNLREKTTASGKRIHLHYDSEHQLQRLVVDDNGRKQTTEYGYDPLGRRIFKKSQESTVIFFWDDERLVSETRDGKAIVYLYAPCSFIPLAQIVQPRQAEKEIYYYHTDQIGTPRELTSSEGQLVWRASYRAWGKITLQERQVQKNGRESVLQPLRFQGQYHDEESGLYYNCYRYYDPDIGRFITQDPLGLAGGENPYQYVLNPTVWVDPLGLMNNPGGSGSSGFSKGNIGKASYKFDKQTKNMTIVSHGAPFGTQTDRVASGSSLAKQVKQTIDKEGGYVNRVTLQSCYSGNGGAASQAQQLANKLNRPVTGYKGKFTEEVRAGASRAYDGAGGITKTFKPSTSGIGKNVSTAVNKAGNTAMKGAINVAKIFKKTN